MASPVIADNKPQFVELKKGEEYLWCACGQSKSQPFCDGSHREGNFEADGFVKATVPKPEQ